MRLHRRHYTFGFTIIELLFVITIILVLAALLLPALKMAKEKGKQISCNNNLREIGHALYVYAEENNGFCPRSSYAFTRIWSAPSGPLIGNGLLHWKTLYGGNIDLGGYIGACPSREEMFEYSINWYFGDYTNVLFKIPHPSQTLLVGERNGGFSIPNINGIYWYSHSKGSNILYCDGRVEWMKYDTVINVGIFLEGQ